MFITFNSTTLLDKRFPKSLYKSTLDKIIHLGLIIISRRITSQSNMIYIINNKEKYIHTLNESMLLGMCLLDDIYFLSQDRKYTHHEIGTKVSTRLNNTTLSNKKVTKTICKPTIDRLIHL